MVIKPDSRFNKIHMEPVNEKVEQIKESKNYTILLTGDRDTGKSVVLQEYLHQSNDKNNPVINLTPNIGESRSFYDTEIHDLFLTSSIVKKLLVYVQKTQADKYKGEFIILDNYINEILKKIHYMTFSLNYSNKYSLIGEDVCKHNEILLEMFLNLALKELDYESLTVVIDNFDAEHASSQWYQKCLYNLLFKRLKVIATISDKNAINDIVRLQETFGDCDVVSIDYSKDLDTMKQILDNLTVKEIVKSGPAKSLLSDEVIAQMIEKTNSNISDMMYAVKRANADIKNFTQENYENYIINYIDKEINKHPMLRSFTPSVRKLHI